MKEFIKQGALVLGAALLSFQALAQIQPKGFTINGKVKIGSKGEKVILSLSTAAGSSVKLDSTLLGADGSFTLKGVDKDRGSFFTVNIADRQKFPLLVQLLDLLVQGLPVGWPPCMDCHNFARLVH